MQTNNFCLCVCVCVCVLLPELVAQLLGPLKEPLEPAEVLPPALGVLVVLVLVAQDDNL